MQITFSDTLQASSGQDPSARVMVRIVDQDRLPSDLDRTLAEGARAARFSGRAGQLFEGFVERDGSIVRMVLAGAGAETAKEGDQRGSHDPAARRASLERAGAAITAKLLTSGEERFTLDAAGLAPDELAAVLTGLRLRAWRHDVYRTRLKDEQKVSLREAVVIHAADGSDAAWETERALAEGVEFARELVAEPANVIFPESFVERCRQRFEGTGAELSFLDEAQMRALGMGALLGVSQGSSREARLLVIKWLGAGRVGGQGGDQVGGGAGAGQPTVFVGKGVTFDTGGISIKPAAGMEDMKWDMGGAAAVAGAMLALAGRKAQADVIGVCGLVENMPDGNAQRPGDVVTTMSGQTVEVINTDAEGRLVLGDVMTWAQREFRPATIVDLATLTGAMIISLGHEHGGLFANDDALADKLLAAGRASGDKLWRFPLSPAYDKLIDSPIADIRNVGPRWAGSITAAQYLQRFVENDTPWAHLDIAGMVWADKPGATWDKGATGYGVRLIDRFVRDTLES